MDLVTGEIGLHSAPTGAGNTVIVGAAHLSGACRAARPTRRATSRVRRQDGKRLWIFHTIPRPGETGTTPG
jgi:quinoprotein glucose dehydrogenase